jgi:hypothetical protein
MVVLSSGRFISGTGRIGGWVGPIVVWTHRRKVITPARDRTPVAESIAIYSTVGDPGFCRYIQFCMSSRVITAVLDSPGHNIHETVHVSELIYLS